MSKKPVAPLEIEDSHEAMRERVEKLERVAEAAKARLLVWTRETYIEVEDALAALEAPNTVPAEYMRKTLKGMQP